MPAPDTSCTHRATITPDIWKHTEPTILTCCNSQGAAAAQWNTPRSVRRCRSHSFFFQAEDGIRDYKVTGVQTCALPIYRALGKGVEAGFHGHHREDQGRVHLGPLAGLVGLGDQRAERLRRDAVLLAEPVGEDRKSVV